MLTPNTICIVGGSTVSRGSAIGVFRIGNRVADFDRIQPDDRRNIPGRGLVDFNSAQLIEHV